MTVTGRADVILDEEGGVPTASRSSTTRLRPSATSDHDLQLQVYADAGRREGLDVRGAYVHDLKAGVRGTVAVDPAAIEHAEEIVIEAAVRLRQRDYLPNPGARCRRCEVRLVCRAALP